VNWQGGDAEGNETQTKSRKMKFTVRPPCDFNKVQTGFGARHFRLAALSQSFGVLVVPQHALRTAQHYVLWIHLGTLLAQTLLVNGIPM
jgi:hypothetical protein